MMLRYALRSLRQNTLAYVFFMLCICIKLNLIILYSTLGSPPLFRGQSSRHPLYILYLLHRAARPIPIDKDIMAGDELNTEKTLWYCQHQGIFPFCWDRLQQADIKITTTNKQLNIKSNANTSINVVRLLKPTSQTNDFTKTFNTQHS